MHSLLVMAQKTGTQPLDGKPPARYWASSASLLVLLSGCASMTDHRSNILDLAKDSEKVEIVRLQQPEFLTLAELKTLVTNPRQGGELGAKLNALWTTPIIDNTAYDTSSGAALFPTADDLGPFLRVMSWNIEKSVRVQIAAKAFSSASEYEALLNTEFLSEEENMMALAERDLLEDVGVLILQEMDVGQCQSGHENRLKTQ